MAPEMEIKPIEEPKYLGELINSLVLLDHLKIISVTMLSLLGMGPYGKRVCHTFKLLKGGVSMFLPPKSKRTKRAGSSTDTAETDPITLKARRKHYHNPDPIAQLVGKVNEACILIDDVECLALVDSGAQISNITIEFVKQLGLKIHQLDRILKFSTSGGGDTPLGDMWKLTLNFLKSKHLMKMCLCL